MEVTNTEMYESTEKEKVPIIKNWFGREDLHLIKIFTNPEKETCKTVRKAVFHIK